jgi:DNA-binding transcriptional LysR family regulator
MIFDRIELFVTVARHQNIGETARQMHVSTSSVCQRLKSLENDFGTKLYKKNNRGIELTQAGRTFLTTASEVLTQLETLRKRLNPAAEKSARSLIIGGTYNPSAKYLPAAIAAFRKTHPDVTITFVTADKPTIEKKVRASKVDVAIIQKPSVSSGFHLESFARDRLIFFAHPTHQLAKKKNLDLQDLARTPIVTREPWGAAGRQSMRHTLCPRELDFESSSNRKAAVRARISRGTSATIA